MVAVRLISDGWSTPGTSMHGYARDTLLAIRGAGVDAVAGAVPNYSDGRRLGGTVGPVARCFLNGFDNPDDRIVHYAGWPPNGRRGASVFNVFDLYAFHDPDPGAFLRRAAYRVMARRARTIVSDSPFIAEEVHRFLGSAARQKTIVVPIPFPEPPSRARVPRTVDVLWVGAEGARKGLAFFLNETRRFPDISVTLRWSPVRRAGPRPETLRAMSSSARPNLRHLGGRLSPDEMERLYAESGCIVSTSSYEGFHMPIMEAYLRGVPIVVPDEPLYRGIYAGSEGVHYYDRLGSGARRLEATVRAALRAPEFQPDPRIREWVSLRHVGGALKEIYEAVAAV